MLPFFLCFCCSFFVLFCRDWRALVSFTPYIIHDLLLFFKQSDRPCDKCGRCLFGTRFNFFAQYSLYAFYFGFYLYFYESALPSAPLSPFQRRSEKQTSGSPTFFGKRKPPHDALYLTLRASPPLRSLTEFPLACRFIQSSLCMFFAEFFTVFFASMRRIAVFYRRVVPPRRFKN